MVLQYVVLQYVVLQYGLNQQTMTSYKKYEHNQK